MKNKKQELILEILAEGGGLNVYRSIVGFNKDASIIYNYFWKTDEMGLEDYDLGFSSKSPKKIKSFEKIMNDIIKKYPGIFNLHPEFIHNDYKSDLIKIIRNQIKKNKIQVVEIDYKKWSEKLDVYEYELADKNPFYKDDFLKILNNFINKKFNIYPSSGWRILYLKHSEFKTIKDYSKFLDKNNFKIDGYFNDIYKAGIYAYFDGDNCLYIGKAKKIKNRLIDHYKSAHNYKKKNEKDGKRQREMFNHYIEDELTLYYINLDDKYNSKVGELLRKTVEGMLQLEYKPEFEEKISYPQHIV